MEIKIDTEFKSLIPPLSKEEFKALEESILNEGCRDRLILWDDILVDGHSRYEICTRNEKPFKTRSLTFDNRDQAKIWIIANQLARRNLSPEQKTYLIGIQYKLEKKEPHRPEGKGDHFDPLKTAEKIADQHHISPATVKRAEKFAEAIDKLPEEEKREVLSGKSRKTKQEIIEKIKPKSPRLEPPQDGMQFARLAIMDLEKIRKDDLEREQAFDFVINWIKKERKLINES